MSEPTFTHDIFLSHSAKDKAALRPLPLRLDRGEGRGEPSAFILQPLLGAPIKGSLAQFL
jgi:hypothetical protein